MFINKNSSLRKSFMCFHVKCKFFILSCSQWSQKPNTSHFYLIFNFHAHRKPKIHSHLIPASCLCYHHPCSFIYICTNDNIVDCPHLHTISHLAYYYYFFLSLSFLFVCLYYLGMHEKKIVHLCSVRCTRLVFCVFRELNLCLIF